MSYRSRLRKFSKLISRCFSSNNLETVPTFQFMVEYLKFYSGLKKFFNVRIHIQICI